MKKIKKYIKDNYLFIISCLILIFLFNYHLPYYINMPGGTIKVNDRIECKKCSDINGSLNMLYVTEYEATVPTYLLSLVIPNWDLERISEQQISNETPEDIYNRNRLMLENSVDNAIYVAYTNSNKEIKVKSKKNIVIATTKNNGLNIGDEVLKINGKEIENIEEIRNIIQNSAVNKKLLFKVLRNNKEEDIQVKVIKQNSKKMIGAVITTDYDYELDPKIKLKFRSSESGSSGGMMLTLSIYTKINDQDIIKGRKIAGTGTIDYEGNVGKIDGIKYKIMGAHKNKMDIVLVPKENYKEAISVAEKNHYKLKIVKVETFKDVIDYLSKDD